jgi:hypothetical protein
VATSLAESDDEVPISPFPSALISCTSDDENLILRPMLSCLAYTSVPLFALKLPHRLVAMADALLGIVTGQSQDWSKPVISFPQLKLPMLY